LMLLRLRELVTHQESFAFETTMASRTFAPFLRKAKSHGYQVAAVFVWLPAVAMAVQRVRDRVIAGGHDVPIDVITRRYWRGLANFWNLYRPLADQWLVYDNSSIEPTIVAMGAQEAPPTIIDRGIWDAFQETITHAERRTSRHGL